MAEPMLIAKSDQDVWLLPKMANRHGVITGATGTGKTVTLQVLAENFSRQSEVGRQIIRGVLGSILGASKRR